MARSTVGVRRRKIRDHECAAHAPAAKQIAAVFATGLLAACTFGGGGAGSIDSLGVAGSTGSATPDAPDTGQGPGEASTSATGSNSSSADSASSDATDGGADATTAGVAQDSTGTPETAKLTFSGANVFGPTTYFVPVTELITLTNEGMVAAGDIAQVDLPSTFEYTGGAFPGGRGTCSSELDAGASCQLEITFTAEILGAQSFELDVEYDDGAGSVATATATIEALVEGSTSNLLVNPSFEDEPTKEEAMPGWTVMSGAWRASFDPADAPDGDRYAFAGEGAMAAPSENLAWQEIDVAGWESSIDAGEIDVAIFGQAGTWDGDTGWLRLVSISEDGEPQVLLDPQIGPDESWPGWMAIEAPSSSLPAGTRTLRVELMCSKPDGDYCNAYFDGLGLIATYSG